MKITHCRSCGSDRLELVLDLGATPIANALLTRETLSRPEDTFPLAVVFCHGCTLLQITETIPPDVIFGADYPYFSSSSNALIQHSKAHVLDLIDSARLGPGHLVVELASNDGYLLKHFVERGVPVLGIDPAAGPAAAARAIGVPTIQDFFRTELADRLVGEGKRADVIIANNVLAHVPDINDFVEGVARLLKPEGRAVFEFPYVLNMIEACEFDTIYHEHVFYYSLSALTHLFGRHGLHLNDAKELPIHGGSLRLTVGHGTAKTARLESMLKRERDLKVDSLAYYSGFADQVRRTTAALDALLRDLRRRGKRIAAYGAAAKGATLLNFMRPAPGTIEYVVDRNPHKQGKWMPGVRLPILGPETLVSDQPDYVLLLVWNFAAEVLKDQAEYRRRGGSFIVPVPEPTIIAPDMALPSHVRTHEEAARVG